MYCYICTVIYVLLYMHCYICTVIYVLLYMHCYICTVNLHIIVENAFTAGTYLQGAKGALSPNEKFFMVLPPHTESVT